MNNAEGEYGMLLCRMKKCKKGREFDKKRLTKSRGCAIIVKEKQGFVTDGCVEYHKGAEHLSDFAVFAEFSRPSGRTYFRFADKCTLF